MQIKPKNICQLHKEACHTLDCAWFIQLRGSHPQTGAEIDEWGCAVAWLPILLVETAKEVRQGAAATESFRNAAADGLAMIHGAVAAAQAGARSALAHPPAAQLEAKP